MTKATILLVALFSGVAQANDTALVADYLHGMDMDQMYANLDQGSATRAGKAPPLDLTKAQLRYKRTLQLVKTDTERRALSLHWAQMQTCADFELKELNAEAEDQLDRAEWRSRLDECNAELVKRAAEVRAAAAAAPESSRPIPKKKKG